MTCAIKPHHPKRHSTPNGTVTRGLHCIRPPSSLGWQWMIQLSLAVAGGARGGYDPDGIIVLNLEVGDVIALQSVGGGKRGEAIRFVLKSPAAHCRNPKCSIACGANL